MQGRLEQVCRVGVIAVTRHHDSNNNSNSKVLTKEKNKNIDNKPQCAAWQHGCHIAKQVGMETGKWHLYKLPR